MTYIRTEMRGNVATRIYTNEVEVVLEVKGNAVMLHMRKANKKNEPFLNDELIGVVRLSETDGTLQLFRDEKL